jgi:hypothetical protein
VNSLSFRTRIMRRLLLLLSGLTAVAIAATILISPELFYASYGIEVAGDAALKNELKAPAGLLLTGGGLMLVGAFRAQWTTQALVISAVIYLSYGLSRLTSFVLDGVPESGLFEAALLEIVIGAVALLALIPEGGSLAPHDRPSIKRKLLWRQS